MFITGGVGAIANDEKFGDDYFLPNDAYLETCAAVGAGFFSQRMNELTGQGKYMDEFERVLYNGVLTGISMEGNNYTYQNPLSWLTSISDGSGTIVHVVHRCFLRSWAQCLTLFTQPRPVDYRLICFPEVRQHSK